MTLLIWKCFEDDLHETNDDEGMYFPERYHVFTEQDEDDVYFITEEEALAHIRKQYELSEDYDTIEKILTYCEEKGLCLGFDEIDVI